MRCRKWEGCSIPVCPLDPETGIRLAEERECGDRVTDDKNRTKLIGITPDERWKYAKGLGLPRHGLNQDEWEMVEVGEPLLAGAGKNRYGWLPEQFQTTLEGE